MDKPILPMTESPYCGTVRKRGQLYWILGDQLTGLLKSSPECGEMETFHGMCVFVWASPLPERCRTLDRTVRPTTTRGVIFICNSPGYGKLSRVSRGSHSSDFVTTASSDES